MSKLVQISHQQLWCLVDSFSGDYKLIQKWREPRFIRLNVPIIYKESLSDGENTIFVFPPKKRMDYLQKPCNLTMGLTYISHRTRHVPCTTARWCPPVISWFLNHNKCIYNISAINQSYWIYERSNLAFTNWGITVSVLFRIENMVDRRGLPSLPAKHNEFQFGKYDAECPTKNG